MEIILSSRSGITHHNHRLCQKITLKNTPEIFAWYDEIFDISDQKSEKRQE